jgi:Spy/CpxP family protein refolding chaperone
MAARMKDHLRSELKLTPEQMEKISPIVDRTTSQLEQIRMETGKRVHETFVKAHEEMSTVLTYEQQQRLQRMAQQHRRMHMFHGGGPPGHPPDE